jgi:hypothetical protein
MNTLQRLRPGTYPSGDITSTYAIHNWPVQADQGVLLWAANLPRLPEPQEFRTPLSFKKVPQGYLMFDVVFSGLTFGMYDYIMDTFYPTGAWWADVSGMAADERDAALYYNARMWRPDRATLIEPGYQGAVFQMVKGVPVA